MLGVLTVGAVIAGYGRWSDRHPPVSEVELYLDGQRLYSTESLTLPVGREPWLCLVLVVDGDRVLRTDDQIACSGWVTGLPRVSARVQAVADAFCATVDVALPRGQRIRSAHACDTVVYHYPPEARDA